jgi:RND family efflux transporter MFP subunit
MKLGNRWLTKVLLAQAAVLMLGSAHAAEFMGIIYPLRDLTLSVQVGGVVEQVNVALGDRVKSGQPLIQQVDQLQQIELRRRRVVLNDISEMQAVEKRKEVLTEMVGSAASLYEQAGTVSREELLKLQLEFESTVGRAEQLREAKKREQVEVELADKEQAARVLRAPMAGVVTMIKVHAGEWAAPGDALVRLVDDSVCELRVNVSPAAARQLELGSRVSVKLEDPTVTELQTGRVTFVSPVIDAASSLVEVRVQMPNGQRRMRPGAKARLRVEGVS